MREFLMLLLALAVIGSLVGMLAHSSLSSTTRAALATVILAVMVAPFLGLIPSLNTLVPELEPTVPPDSDGYIEVGEGAFCEGIALAVEERFSFGHGEVVAVCRDFDFTAMRAGAIHISLSGSALLGDYRQICTYVEENFTDGGRCYIDELGRE